VGQQPRQIRISSFGLIASLVSAGRKVRCARRAGGWSPCCIVWRQIVQLLYNNNHPSAASVLLWATWNGLHWISRMRRIPPARVFWRGARPMFGKMSSDTRATRPPPELGTGTFSPVGWRLLWLRLMADTTLLLLLLSSFWCCNPPQYARIACPGVYCCRINVLVGCHFNFLYTCVLHALSSHRLDFTPYVWAKSF
jgi:hypothetical protein